MVVTTARDLRSLRNTSTRQSRADRSCERSSALAAKFESMELVNKEPAPVLNA